MVRKHYENLKSFAIKSKRVWHVLKKPAKKEFWSITKISAIGIVLLGALGFLISILMSGFVK